VLCHQEASVLACLARRGDQRMQSGGVDELKCADIEIDASVCIRERDQLALDRRRDEQVKFAAQGKGRDAVGVGDNGGGGSATPRPPTLRGRQPRCRVLWLPAAPLAVAHK
jgi:hypothetical protein